MWDASRRGRKRQVVSAPEGLTFGKLLREYRHAAGLSQAELAERAGLSARGLSDLERGARLAPQRETLALLVAALQLAPGDRDA